MENWIFLPYSSVSKWGWILNLHRKWIFIYHHDFIFARISRHFIGLFRHFTWCMEMYQMKRLALKNPWKFKIKIQFFEIWWKIQVKIQDSDKKMVSWIFNSISLNLFYACSFIWDINFHNLKYLAKPIKCLKIRVKVKLVRKINEIFLCIFTYIF